MATTKTTAPNVEVYLARPYHATDLKQYYEASDAYGTGIDTAGAITATEGTIDDFETAVDGQITQAKTDIQTLITAFKALWPFADEAAFDTAADDLLTNIEGEIDANITPNYTQLKTDIAADINANIAEPTFHDILDQVKTDAVSLIQSDSVTYPVGGAIYVCPECQAQGKRQILDTDGSPTGVYEESELCNGNGYTAIQYIKNPNTDYIEAP